MTFKIRSLFLDLQSQPAEIFNCINSKMTFPRNNYQILSVTINQFIKSKVPARLVLYVLSLTCTIVSFLKRSLMSIAILAMVKETNASDGVVNYTETLCVWSTNNSITKTSYGGELDWSLDVQYYVLTSFYWTYIIAQTVGGYASQRYGSKLLISLGVLVSSICTICIPLATASYVLVIILQLINGFGQGLLWPSLYGVISWWVPFKERGRFISCFQGGSIGGAISLVTSGFIIASVGWKYVFYIWGGIGLLWCLFWQFLMYNKPELHPRISAEELNHIKKGREEVLQSGNLKVPWLSIICSVPVWAIAVSSFGRTWYVSVVSVYGPTYLKTVIGLNVQMNGLLSGSISMATYLATLIFSYISDKLLTYSCISTIASRKLFTAIGQIIPGLLCIAMSYLNCDLTLIIAVWALSYISTTASFCGTMVNIVDVAPNFTGPVSSIIQTILMLPSVLSTLVVNRFLEQGKNLESWRGIFNTSAGVAIATYIFYFLFASAEVNGKIEIIFSCFPKKNRKNFDADLKWHLKRC
ncbi:hypothetical protein RI129_009100 [Pyrocoelia pectoralis]|uniref:Major facilitator superfamily (MFS) profile domain-containing protein n=1 Tax=Pyrocoelia pectoralis TaxID=417401 RepID=A0AAN7VCQ5_9COLE